MDGVARADPLPFSCRNRCWTRIGTDLRRIGNPPLGKNSRSPRTALDESLQLLNLHQQNGGAGYDDALGSPLAAESGAAAGDTVTVYRVQGGVMPNASKTLITLDGAGNPIIQDGTLNVSIGDGGAHSQYFQALRPGSTVTSFEIPSWMHDLIQENAIPQDFYTSNPLNQGGLAPKITDINTPGLSYELPSPWGQWLQENAIPGSGKVK